MGLPTMFERPTISASSPTSGLSSDLMSISEPSGVQGTMPPAPVATRPTLIGWKPSTSLAGSTASSTAVLSMCFGSGSCTRMPSTSLSAFSRAISASSSAWLVLSLRRCSNERMPASTVLRALLPT